jgi:hypothetical protein
LDIPLIDMAPFASGAGRESVARAWDEAMRRFGFAPIAGHPLSLYRAAHVPIVLSADDEGVFRIDLTHEYMRAVTEQHFSYLDLKTVSRNGLEYSFLPVNEKARLRQQLEADLAAYENGALGTARHGPSP